MAARKRGIRRYPAFGLIVLAAALAAFLPSALNIPNSNPGELAELAPVPGSGFGAADLARLESVSGGGIRAGGGVRGGSSGRAAGTPGQGRLVLKRCVGNPPRQTEDPLSPPCVPYFEGDNFGFTHRGITRDEIKIVVYTLPDPNAGRPAGTFSDYDSPARAEDNQLTAAIKAYSRYFNDRYQTYRRRVHFIGFHSPSSATPEQHRANAERIARESAPFAIVNTLDDDEPFVIAAANLEIVTFDFAAYRRESYQRVAPHLISYLPDLEDQGSIMGAYACRKRAGLPARHSGNPEDVDRVRKFGLLYREDAAAPGYGHLKSEVKERMAEQCAEQAVEAAVSLRSERVASDMALAMNKLRGSGVTTVLDFGASPAIYTNAAASQGWYPEWLIGTRFQRAGSDTNQAGRQYNALEWKSASGHTYDARRGPRSSQQWLLAYKEACRSCPEPAVAGTIATLYETLNLMFHAIQAAGPRLTPASIDRGIHAIPQRPSPTPDTPAAYFTRGNYSFIKDAMEIWWDPSGIDPTDGQPGCYRYTNDGRRFRAMDWEPGDSGAFEGGTCQGGIG